MSESSNIHQIGQASALPTQDQPVPHLEEQRNGTQDQPRPEVERQRKEAEENAQSSLDKDALAALDHTRKAVNAIGAGKVDEALAEIERAIGKLNILLARNPATALVPVTSTVQIIDTAPTDTQTILEIAQDASLALDRKDYPTARAFLHALMSEIRVRTYNLPLATYPDALKEAGRLLANKSTKEANGVLSTALNTLVVVDNVTPLSLIRAGDAINQAQSRSQEDRKTAQDLLETAKHELERARALGYTGKDREYKSLSDQISKLEGQLNRREDAAANFSKLKDRLAAFLKRQSAQKRG